MLLYFYDLKGTKIEYTRVKRRFYYHLKRSKLAIMPLRTKSVIMVPEEMETIADIFFSKFKGNIEVYKAKATTIEEIL